MITLLKGGILVLLFLILPYRIQINLEALTTTPASSTFTYEKEDPMLDRKNMQQLTEEVLQRFSLARIPVTKNTTRLVMGTMAVESRLTYLRQRRGPARGLVQMEPDTAMDLYTNYLSFRHRRFRKAFHKATGLRLKEVFQDKRDLSYHLQSSIALQIVLCRLQYWRSPLPIPDTVEGFAHIWKVVYNTRKGKGTVDKFIQVYLETFGKRG